MGAGTDRVDVGEGGVVDHGERQLDDGDLHVVHVDRGRGQQGVSGRQRVRLQHPEHAVSAHLPSGGAQGSHENKQTFNPFIANVAEQRLAVRTLMSPSGDL